MFCGQRCIQPPRKLGDPPQKRAMERFCEGPLFNFLLRFKFPIMVAWLLLIAASGASAGLQLRTADRPAPIGREDLDVTRGFEILLEEFTFGGAPTVSFAWGLDDVQPIEEWGTSNDENKVRFKRNTLKNLVQPSGQEELLGLCAAADLGKDDKHKARCGSKECLILGSSLPCEIDEDAWQMFGLHISKDMLCGLGRFCFMEEFADWWAWTDGDCPGSTEINCKSKNCNWNPVTEICYSQKTRADYRGLPEEDFIAKLESTQYREWRTKRLESLRTLNRAYDADGFQGNTGYVVDSKGLTFAYVSFNATIPNRNTVDQANKIYYAWEALRKEYAANIGGFQTTSTYDFMVTQNELVKAAIAGILSSMGICLVFLLLSTRNLFVSLLGMVNIIGISVIILGIMPLLGWQLGRSECIFLIAVVGLSVDYSVHLLHAYKSPEFSTREERSKHALAEMGISVLNSAITTLLAAGMLFLCGFYFFFQFGAFIFFVIGFSILMSMTFLIPLLLALGPQGDTGNFCKRRL